MYVEATTTVELLGDPTELGRLIQSLLLVNADKEFVVFRRDDEILIRTHPNGMHPCPPPTELV